MTGRTYLLLIGVLVGALLVLEATRDRPLDLRVRLERTGDAPFDAEVFFESLPAWLGQPVEAVGEPPFVRLEDSTETGLTYLFLALRFAPEEAEAERLLRFVARGNTVVVAANGGEGPFFEALSAGDSLADGLYLDPVYGGFDAAFARAEITPDTLRLVAPGVDGEYVFPVDVRSAEIVGLDPDRSEVLGVARWPFALDDDDHDMVTLARVRHGQGEVIVSSTPLAFTNAALTGDGDAAAYVGAVVAALPDQPVLWDDHSKPSRQPAQTPLRFVLQTPALRGAYGLLLLAGILYVAFRGRRWQRAVPVLAPPPNAQREFARTVGRLRFVHRDDRALAERMGRHVLERLHTELRIADPALDEATAPLAAARAGVPLEEARALFSALHAAHAAPDADVLVRLDARVARFFRHTGAARSSGAHASDRPPLPLGEETA